MTAIQRIPFEIQKVFSLKIRRFSEIMSTELHNGTPVLWVRGMPNQELEDRTFACVKTDEAVDDDHLYIGTLQIQGGLYPWHVFEIVPDENPS